MTYKDIEAPITNIKKLILTLDMRMLETDSNIKYEEHNKRLYARLKTPTSKRKFLEAKTNLLLYIAYKNNLNEIKTFIVARLTKILDKWFGAKKNVIIDYFINDMKYEDIAIKNHYSDRQCQRIIADFVESSTTKLEQIKK